MLLRHEHATVLVAGVNDYGAHHFDEAQRSDPQAALKGAPSQIAVKILLAHQPRSAEAAARGRLRPATFRPYAWRAIFPVEFFVPMQQPFTAGLNRWHDMWVYTSRGTGYWGPPKRLWAPSEIALLRLVPAAQ